MTAAVDILQVVADQMSGKAAEWESRLIQVGWTTGVGEVDWASDLVSSG
jgi:hypothetical protein